ncbi:MAG: N-acetyl-alpha-D-glucosaminyl L-malate synthase BshA [Myxococcales bacterium]|nr:N-acetyl-alpha-D-glucosaminyl L-malate synthase BshA [Myxococcales bacterium]
MRRLRIGITCYPTLGGSGIIAAEVGMALARRGHAVHFVGAEQPRRLEPTPGVWFHAVPLQAHAVFPRPPEALALASTLAHVAAREGLDVLHAHYAVPHAVSAWMATELLPPDQRPGLVTTLHGTDVTLLADDPAYAPLLRHCVARSDVVTTPSAWLAAEAERRLGAAAPATEVIPNFVDPQRFRPANGVDAARLAALFGGGDAPVVAHVSSFRAIKRVPMVLDVFARLRVPARLLLIGDGPERSAVEAAIEARGLGDRVRLLGNLERFEPLLRACAAFLLPSASESFGLAALEALASGVPVVASAVGGLPEVVRDGETGHLVAADDAADFAACLERVLGDADHAARLRAAARADVLARFQPGPIIERYEAALLRAAR